MRNEWSSFGSAAAQTRWKQLEEKHPEQFAEDDFLLLTLRRSVSSSPRGQYASSAAAATVANSKGNKNKLVTIKQKIANTRKKKTKSKPKPAPVSKAKKASTGEKKKKTAGKKRKARSTVQEQSVKHPRVEVKDEKELIEESVEDQLDRSVSPTAVVEIPKNRTAKKSQPKKSAKKGSPRPEKTKKRTSGRMKTTETSKKTVPDVVPYASVKEIRPSKKEMDACKGPYDVKILENWYLRLRQLFAFKKKHGHCNVPSNYPENQVLGTVSKRIKLPFKMDHCGPRLLQRLPDVPSISPHVSYRTCNIFSG